jgi:hypothetical protein
MNKVTTVSKFPLRLEGVGDISDEYGPVGRGVLLSMSGATPGGSRPRIMFYMEVSETAIRELRPYVGRDLPAELTFVAGGT